MIAFAIASVALAICFCTDSINTELKRINHTLEKGRK